MSGKAIRVRLVLARRGPAGDKQAQARPDWHIAVQETLEVGDHVVLRARAGGTISHDDEREPLAEPYRKDIEWLSVYRIEARRISAAHLLAVADRSDQAD